jgi:hypothetical protein
LTQRGQVRLHLPVQHLDTLAHHGQFLGQDYHPSSQLYDLTDS